jgi:hypothetical protein
MFISNHSISEGLSFAMHLLAAPFYALAILLASLFYADRRMELSLRSHRSNLMRISSM